MAENRGPFPRLFPRLSPVPASQRKAHGGPGFSVVPLNTKASLLPRGAYGEAYEFFSPDGGRTIIDISGGSAFAHGLAFAAYWYVATRWRAQKIAEAPLMVVEEDQESGAEEWLPEHELAEPLDMPSPDYDMGELLERTSRYLDDTAECIWVIDSDRAGRVSRLTPFKKGEFTVKRVGDRLYGVFEVNTLEGPREYSPEEVCYFRDTVEGWHHGGRSRLDVAMSWLRLGEKSRQTIRDLLDNSIWPSAVIIPDKDWNPDPNTLEMYKQDIQAYGSQGYQGKPFVQLGGGSFVQLSAKIRDLVPEEVLNRVESVVAAVSGIPAVVLQFQIGMENSPWSNLPTARKMAYDDAIIPAWRKMERVMTRQLLRPLDGDTTHYIRFDKSQVDALKEDRQVAATTAALIGRIASVNERRSMVGLEPTDDEGADDIPELKEPAFGMFGAPATPPDEEENPDDEEEPAPEEEEEKRLVRVAPFLFRKATTPAALLKVGRVWFARKAKVSGIQASFIAESQAMWGTTSQHLLENDKDAIADIITSFLTDATHKSVESKERGKQRAISAVVGYLRSESQPRWAKASTPLLIQAAERSVAVVAADLGISYSLLHPNVVRFSTAEVGHLITNVSKTTKEVVERVVTEGLAAGRTTADITKAIQESAAFTRDRSLLIARTETTRAFNGGPQEALASFGRETGRQFVKTWSGALDDRERDEHVAMEGETVPVTQPFSNGRMYPDEPNCRCVALHSEVEE